METKRKEGKKERDGKVCWEGWPLLFRSAKLKGNYFITNLLQTTARRLWRGQHATMLTLRCWSQFIGIAIEWNHFQTFLSLVSSLSGSWYKWCRQWVEGLAVENQPTGDKLWVTLDLGARQYYKWHILIASSVVLVVPELWKAWGWMLNIRYVAILLVQSGSVKHTAHAIEAVIL